MIKYIYLLYVCLNAYVLYQIFTIDDIVYKPLIIVWGVNMVLSGLIYSIKLFNQVETTAKL